MKFLTKCIRFKRREFGATLIELLLYMGLLSLMITLLTGIFVSTLDVQLESQAHSSVQEDGEYILTRLKYDILRASAVIQPGIIGAQSNTLEITVSAIPYTYALGGTTLQLTNSIDGTVILNSARSTVSNLSFQKISSSAGKNTVRINFTVNSVAKRNSGNESKQFQTTVSLRCTTTC